MAKYIMSDIHGQYKLFTEFLEKINFSEEDDLYINGDLIDRCIGSAYLIDFVLQNDNVNLILGNHEEMFIKAYEKVDLNEDLDIRDAIYKNEDGEEIKCKIHKDEDVSLWLANGGFETIQEIRRFNRHSGRDLFKEFYEYLKECPKWMLIDEHIIFHAGVGFYFGKDYSDEEIQFILARAEKDERFLWGRYLWDSAFLKGSIKIPSEYTGVIGHTPIQNTDYYVENPIQDSIFKESEHGSKIINIDFGTYKSGMIGAYEMDNKEVKVLIDGEIKKFQI